MTFSSPPGTILSFDHEHPSDQGSHTSTAPQAIRTAPAVLGRPTCAPGTRRPVRQQRPLRFRAGPPSGGDRRGRHDPAGWPLVGGRDARLRGTALAAGCLLSCAESMMPPRIPAALHRPSPTSCGRPAPLQPGTPANRPTRPFYCQKLYKRQIHLKQLPPRAHPA